MDKKTIFLLVLNISGSMQNADDFSQRNSPDQLAQLERLKAKLQQYKTHDEIFTNLQQYGRCAGQVASSMVLILNKQKEEKNKEQTARPKLSGNDQANIISTVVACFVLLVEFARFCHQRSVAKKTIQAMTYQDFVALFPQLLLLEYQIILMRTLINLTLQGSLAEQVFAQISLTKMALPYPYAKFCNKAAKKMYEKCFDRFGNFVYERLDAKHHPYKKFAKKVAQSWQQLLTRAQQIPTEMYPSYSSEYAGSIDTAYNNALINIIQAKVNQQNLTLADAQHWSTDALVQKLLAES
jgi:hypothetical protein